ncbi:hypothetical protein [Shimia abyssi]|uniref:Uncharacterized protein n=1 Tax=Shimia abyssi TaxID=1662395 RepID=A0A2P8FAE6_9RHOB|nr:hypothetical protein [Shimia abyssi]PSL18696.1 hypothetical protein CLV88_10981 [Shimia abyssi]
MSITRSNTPTQQTSAIQRELAGMNGPCIGCLDCRGLCVALIDAITVPDAILSKPGDS